MLTRASFERTPLRFGGGFPAALLALAFFFACSEPPDPTPPTEDTGDEPPLTSSWTLAGEALDVEVEGQPFRYRIVDKTGQVLLESLAQGDGDGYGAVGLSEGEVRWLDEGRPSAGHFTFEGDLEPWEDAWEVVEAETTNNTLSIKLAVIGSEAPSASMDFEIEGARVRVHAEALGGDAPRAWAAAFETPEGEGFLGFGERFNRTNQRGVDVHNFVEEGGIGRGEGTFAGPDNPIPGGEAMSYYPVPFFISTQGYGFWLDSTWRSEFNLATAREDAWRVWHIGPTLDFEVYAPIAADPRPWPYHLIDQFTARVGRPMTPPAWAFGPRRRINVARTIEGVEEIEVMRDLDLAITTVDDNTHFLPGGRHVGNEQTLSAWIERAGALGYRVNAYFLSHLDTDTSGPLGEVVEEGLAGGFFLKNAAGDPMEVFVISGLNQNRGTSTRSYMIDFSNPEAVAYYQRMLQWAVDLGYSGWMYDFGEYVQPEALAFGGLTGEAFHNLSPVLYQKAAFDHLEAGARAGDWLTFVRSGFTGASQYTPFVWSGDPAASFEDSDGLPSMIRAGVSIGISGAPHWGGDIGGYHCSIDGYDAADEELLTRWIQQGAMTPNMQDQNACAFAPGNGEKASIFTAPAAMEAWRRYARLHTRLFPYLYTLAGEASATGAPLMRHPFLEHPDPALADTDDIYYLGPALLVAPVIERDAREKSLRLPAGSAYLRWPEGERFEGGQQITVPAPLDALPLFLRADHLIALLDPTIDTLSEEDHPEVVGPTDVDGVYDVVGFITGEATTLLHEGTTLSATLEGAFAPPEGFEEVSSEEALADCEGCWRQDDLGSGLIRVRISTSEASISAGELLLEAQSARRIRWDIYLTD